GPRVPPSAAYRRIVMRTGRRMGRPFASHLEPHLLQEYAPARITMQRSQVRTNLRVGEPRVAQCDGSLEPLKRLFDFAPGRMNLGDLKGVVGGVSLDELA